MNPLFIVNGIERSGTTWITRLLAQCLDSPSITRYHDAEYSYKADSVVWGLDRPNRPICRLHYPVSLIPPDYYNIPILLVVRDPRDHAVSHYHASTGIMKRPDIDSHARWVAGTWDIFYSQWLGDERWWMRYEDMHENPYGEIRAAIGAFGLPIPSDETVTAAIHDNEFSRMENHSKRKGKVGEWRASLKPETVHYIEQACGDTMRVFDYERICERDRVLA